MLKEAYNAGASLRLGCEILEITIRTWQRWKQNLKDKRRGPISAPSNKLTEEERNHILKVVNLPAHRHQPPNQIVPELADQGTYIGSESTIYRILHDKKMMAHRNASRPKTHSMPTALSALKPNQLWSWDITYLPSNIRGKFFYLYMFIDIFSRKIVGFDVYDEQSAEHAAIVVSKAYVMEKVNKNDVTLHSDNGGPMKGSMMLAKLDNLGITPSFSRPSVSNDNPFSEAIFKTLKYCPKYPNKPFISLQSAMLWVEQFVKWYNNKHHHSGISFVTPIERHTGKDKKILEKRKQVYELAKQKNPARWSKKTRNWEWVSEVFLNKQNK